MEKKMDKYIITEKGKRFLERAQDVVLNILPSLNSVKSD